MAFAPSEQRRTPMAIKILIAGGFGAGKTTMVGSVSETRPLRTEEILTDRSVGVDDTSAVSGKTTTTVAMDFGRINLTSDYVLYLFGTPGQERFWFIWDELSTGALGAVVLADTRRLADCFLPSTTSKSAASRSLSRSTASTARPTTRSRNCAWHSSSPVHPHRPL